MRKRSWQGIDKLTRLLPTEYASNKVGAKSVEEGREQNTDSQSSAEGKALCGSTALILHLHPPRPSQRQQLARGKLCSRPCVSFLLFISSVLQQGENIECVGWHIRREFMLHS